MRTKYEQEGVICENLEFFFPRGGGVEGYLCLLGGGGIFGKFTM